MIENPWVLGAEEPDPPFVCAHCWDRVWQVCDHNVCIAYCDDCGDCEKCPTCGDRDDDFCEHGFCMDCACKECEVGAGEASK